MIPAHWVAIGVTVLIIGVETFVYFALSRLRGGVTLQNRQLLAAGSGLVGVAAIVVMVLLLGLSQTDTIISVIGAIVPIYLFFSAALLRKPPDKGD